MIELSEQEYSELKEYERMYNELIEALKCAEKGDTSFANSLIILSHTYPDKYAECINTASQIKDFVDEKAKLLN